MDVEPDGVGGAKRKAEGDLDEGADRSKEPGERSDGNAGVISEETTTNVDLNSGTSIEQMMQVFGVEIEDGQDKEYLNMIQVGMSKRANPGVVLDLRTDWDLTKDRHAEAVWKHLTMIKPMVVIGSSTK